MEKHRLYECDLAWLNACGGRTYDDVFYDPEGRPYVTMYDPRKALGYEIVLVGEPLSGWGGWTRRVAIEMERRDMNAVLSDEGARYQCKECEKTFPLKAPTAYRKFCSVRCRRAHDYAKVKEARRKASKLRKEGNSLG